MLSEITICPTPFPWHIYLAGKMFWSISCYPHQFIFKLHHKINLREHSHIISSIRGERERWSNDDLSKQRGAGHLAIHYVIKSPVQLQTMYLLIFRVSHIWLINEKILYWDLWNYNQLWTKWAFCLWWCPSLKKSLD